MRLQAVLFILLFAMSFAAAAAEGELVNLARLDGVSYQISAGSHWADHNADKNHTMLTDGILNSGKELAVCYDFFRQPDEEKYITVTMDLKKRYQISKIVLHGLNRTSLFNVRRCIFLVSNDGVFFEPVVEFSADDEVIQKIGTGAWKLEAEVFEEARFVRVSTWTNYWLNLEELEVYGTQ